MCEDYRPLNIVTPQDKYPMPILDNIGDSNIFTIMDLKQGFNHIVLVMKDCKKMTFHGSNKLWEWLVMPFGSKNTPFFFQQIMDQVLKGVDFLKCYIDDVLMHNKGLLQHLVHLEELFKRFHEVNMKIHPKKCEFAITSVVYLGHKILPNGVMAHWAKVVTILEMPNPINVHTLRSFIKLCNYYMIYVQDFNTIIHPFYALLKKDVAWTWSEEAHEAFNTLKEKLSKFPILRDMISTRFSFYTLIGVLLVLVLFLANLMKKARNMLSPMHPEITTRPRTTTLRMRGSVLLLYGLSYFSGPIFMAPSSLCISTISLSSG